MNREEEGVRDKTIFPLLQSISLESRSLISFYSGSDLKCPCFKKNEITESQDGDVCSTISSKNCSSVTAEGKKRTLQGIS